ncbi:MAG: hypothetical protein ACFB10_20235 [Salibacteraceae bacterium]
MANREPSTLHAWFGLLPPIGIAGFFGLYLYASTLYPGGNQADLNATGFDWIHNYWCNLMLEAGMNGSPNPARPFAIFGMGVLCAGLSAFFIQFAVYFAQQKGWKFLIAINGIIAMLATMFLFTNYHDLLTIVASMFGLVTVSGILWELWQSDLKGYKISSILCLLLLGANNFIYYTGHFLEALPMLQKVSFLFVLAWIVGLHRTVLRRQKQLTAN